MQPPAPPKISAVEVVPAQPTEAESAAIAQLSVETNRSLPQVAYVVKVRLRTKPPVTSMAWALYVHDVLIPKYWEYKDGIYFTVLDPQFFADHKGKRLRFSQNGVDFVDTGVRLAAPTTAAAESKRKTARSARGSGPVIRRQGGPITAASRRVEVRFRHLAVFLFLLSFAILVATPVAAQEPVRLGVLTIRSGPIASCGRQMEEGLQFALKERSGMLAGRKVEVFFGDSAGQPAQTRSKTLELVERNKVHVLTGPVAAFEAYAISDYVRQTETPMVISPAAADDITQRKTNPWFVRATMSGSQVTHPLGEYAAKKLGYKRIATIADDFAYGHEHTAGFQRTFEEKGGKIVQKLWPPIVTPDYGPYIAQLKSNVDAVYAGFGPTNGQRFLKQYSEFGLKLPVLGMVTTTEESSLKSMGDEALGVVTAGTYSAAIETPTNRKWVQAMRADYKDDPGYCTIGGYLGVLFIEAGMKGVNGKVEDKPAFMKALRGVQLADTPQGPIRLDAYGNPIVNVYIRKVERREGRLMNVVIDTYRDVSQFWKYDPATFLAAPVYSRDYPPSKNIE